MFHDIKELFDQIIHTIEAHKAALIMGLGWITHIFVPKFWNATKCAWSFLDGKGIAGIRNYIKTGSYESSINNNVSQQTVKEKKEQNNDEIKIPATLVTK